MLSTINYAVGKWNFRQSRYCLNQTIIIDTAEMSGILKQTMNKFDKLEPISKLTISIIGPG